MSLIYPMLAQIGWTFFLLVLTAWVRNAALKTRKVRVGEIALGNGSWPEKVKAVGNNLNNQFETPVLFFALCGIAIHVGATHWGVVALAWVYIVCRVIHTAIHISTNHVLRRFQAFLVGVIALFGMFIVIVARLA